MTQVFYSSHNNSSSILKNYDWKMRKRDSIFFMATTILCLMTMMPIAGEAIGRMAYEDNNDQQETDGTLWALGINPKGQTIVHKVRGDRVPGHQCYSCMSRTLGSLWEGAQLDSIYQQQQSFTDHCHKPEEHRPAVFVRQCSFTCISMLIEVQFAMGAKAQLRGCFDSIFRNGFNESNPEVKKLKLKDYCQKFNLSDITNKKLRYDSIVEVCSCRGHLCNGGLMPTSGVSSAWRTSKISSIFLTSNIFYVLFIFYGYYYFMWHRRN